MPTTDTHNQAATAIYQELLELSEFMPERYRTVFRFRWGLGGEFPHLTSQTGLKFEIPKGSAEEMLDRCLWNIARHAQHREMPPAVRGLLGENPADWVTRAWQHTQQRWGNDDAQFSETVLLLAVAGIDVPAARQMARQHMVDLGLRNSNPWGRPLSEQQQADKARSAIDRILEQTIWPTHPAARPADVSGHRSQRPLPDWAPAKTGTFISSKLKRPVQFDSDLERLILRQLDTDPRVTAYQEQPVTIPYKLDGEQREYTPDVIVQLDDGRALIIEAKPLAHLGQFDNWMKWAALASRCTRQGLGYWIGSPQRAITEHHLTRIDPDKHELALSELAAGPITSTTYKTLQQLIGYEQLGLIATHEMLDWRTDPGHIRPARGEDRENAKRLWAQINAHSYDRVP
jgi:hypothetical protein